MVAPKINMHGKIYNLYDETDRLEKEAKAELEKIHKTGKRAFLNPRKQKDKPTTYYIYIADPTPRKPREVKEKKVEQPKEVKVEQPKEVKTEQPKKVNNGKKTNGKKGKK